MEIVGAASANHGPLILPACGLAARLCCSKQNNQGITLVARSCITELRRAGTGWDLDRYGWPRVAGYDAVVLANALGYRALLRDLSASAPGDANWMTHVMSLQAVHGLLFSHQSGTRTGPIPSTRSMARLLSGDSR